MTMNPTQSQSLRQQLTPVLYFALAQWRAALHNKKGLFFTLLTPLFMLILFTLMAGSDSDILRFMFPAIVSLSVMLGGNNQAMRIVTWRQLGIFQRLAATPTPLSHLVLGDVLAQAVLATLQGFLTLLFGVFVLRLPVDGFGTLVTVAILLLVGVCFNGYGAAIATVAKRPETANVLFIFTLMPMFFLGGGFPPGVLPEAVTQIGRWLPVGVANGLIQPLLMAGQISSDVWGQIVALLVYTLLFMGFTVRFFRASA
jgi:ABC-2 type transport system permease protein